MGMGVELPQYSNNDIKVIMLIVSLLDFMGTIILKICNNVVRLEFLNSGIVYIYFR